MEKSGKKFCGRTDAKMINEYQWEGFGIGCGSLGLFFNASLFVQG